MLKHLMLNFLSQNEFFFANRTFINQNYMLNFLILYILIFLNQFSIIFQVFWYIFFIYIFFNYFFNYFCIFFVYIDFQIDNNRKFEGIIEGTNKIIMFTEVNFVRLLSTGFLILRKNTATYQILHRQNCQVESHIQAREKSSSSRLEW